jgi:hypothetical protein
MNIRIECLREPDLEFGSGALGPEPKRVLKGHGPLDRQEAPEIIRLGLVGPEAEVEAARKWLPRLNGMLVATESNSRRFRDYPGGPRGFSARFEVDPRFVRALDETRFQMAIETRAPSRRFEALLELYQGRVSSLFSDKRPERILVCFPEEIATLRIANPGLTEKERRVLEQLQAEEESDQLSLFSATPEEMELAAELRPQAEELLFRSFYRALKASTMSDKNPVPIQVMRRHTYVETEADQQSEATRAWNLASAIYYKSGRIPWRPSGLSRDTCFVGISFHHLKRRVGEVVYASVAQAFSNDLEPFALKGASIPPEQRRNRQPYLSQDQSAELIARVIEMYRDQAGNRPSRIVIHKTSRFDPEEQAGFRSALSTVPACDLVWLGETTFRLLRKGMEEPWRGTLCSVGSDEHYLFTTGYVPYWDEYPGPHVPAPLQIGSPMETDIRERAREILALSKMNWNSAEGIARHPITLSFARKVGTIMTEMGDNPEPNPSYRFYM